ncbi:VOC family protein [Microbacterium aurantiacum]|uniref:VOC family protein n=1 Tax=Microbacterium aurantiacum TaxID=162393 RepID=A0AAJ2HLG6_9MICO|nr:VOC family protein [Microbacterium aurantiacum]MDS0246484.1 VOC family protein [Microbacterium aurantiacum]
MTLATPPTQLRLIIETDDFDRTVAFYRDVLGLTERPAFATEGDDRVAILEVGDATIEIATPTHARNIDVIENVPASEGPSLRLALEVADTPAAVRASREAGIEVIADATDTPFRSVNARVQGPAGWQVTFFQEKESLDERRARPGFETDDRRAR